MLRLNSVSEEEIQSRIKAIMKGMGTELLKHNAVAIYHEQIVLAVMIQCDGMNIEKVKNIAGGAAHISDKFIDQSFKRFAAWEIFRTHDNALIMTDQENNGSEQR